LPTKSSLTSTELTLPNRSAADRGAAETPRRRTLYGRRQGRPLKAGRQQALAVWLPRLGITLPADGALDAARLFGGGLEDLWLEVGFGSGEHLLAQAAAHPRIGLIGCEPFINGMAALLSAIAREPARAANIRVLMDDARPLIAALPDHSLGRVFVLFPDPWPKARHEKRRFISPETLDALARVMKPGAELRVASDDEGMIAWAAEQLCAHPAFTMIRGAAEWRERPADWPFTRYEAKALAAGRRPAYFAVRRRPS
jgi:tRNA (guanine-N7-)-methyltransferase